MSKRRILDSQLTGIILKRIALEITENHGDMTNSAIIGLQPRGIRLASQLKEVVSEITGNKNILYGELDSTFYRDDFRKDNKILVPNSIQIDFLIENKTIIIVDDVLYTGRSVRSALNALGDFGRPRKIELMTLVDRTFNRELPIKPDYVGEEVDTRANDRVEVLWNENQTTPEVWIITE
ncbi:MAG: bifunctional pyr operon transcriptional regulator/uracil phosphoribosyltransferase PyrR [Flavobacteriales bacterium]|nr:bifunctional pyr operon transcriptional regulator/uracil phosphoribosyltransferase PyrR [Flavobacteriales bacterium]